MELTLSIVSYHRFTSDLEVEKSFLMHEHDMPKGYVIGRSPQCDWCLPDHERVISSMHARIDCGSHGFTITDISTNGVFINRSVTPLGKDSSHTFRDGDFFAFGEYEFEVSIRESGTLNGDVLSEDSDLFNDHRGIEKNESNSKSSPIVPEEWDFGISTRQLDPTPMATPVNQQEEAEIDTLASNVSTSSEKDAPSAIISSNIEDSFIAPRSVHSHHNEELAIPENWSANLLVEPTSNIQPQATEVSEPAAISSEVVGSRNGSQQRTDEIKIKDSPASQPVASMTTLSSNTSEQAIQAFIQGLGISNTMVPSEHDERWWFELGTSMQYLMTGLMDALHHRTEFKQSNRLNQTLFKRQENNPLKFSASLEDAIHNLFNRKSASFLPAGRAIKEAFSDLDSHEQALLAGLDGTVSGMMKLLAPESIAMKTEEQAFWGRLNPARSKAQNWANYEAMYQRLNEDLQSASQSFYLDDFVKAYEAHLKSHKVKG
ncbi:type VI secretion system-associated FHA domain protein TagH [Photobacterium aquae]|uniref:type VI secretion system-associated FHA domain protein TagH n=1 Tax=Photobacterium aquae TaxID=1195763 RepID=UPI00069D9510|nr:type VI secretion system-associated FHA domain protein TagH [Photobacterium aquae]